FRMGGRLTCYSCAPLFDSGTATLVHAELFSLSGKRNKWIKLHDDLLEVKVFREGQESRSSSSIPPPSLIPDITFRIQAITTDGRVVFDSTLGADAICRLSDCFIQVVDFGGRTLGLNLISTTEADALMHAMSMEKPLPSSSTTPPATTLSARGHSTLARIRVVSEWKDESIRPVRDSSQTTVVLITPVFLVFHYDKGLVHINILESVFEIQRQNIRITSGSRIWDMAVADPHRFLSHILNQSSQVLAKTSSRLAATVALRAKLRLLRSSELHNRQSSPENRLRMAILEQRISCLEGRLHPLMMPRLPSVPLPPGCGVSTFFLYLVNMNKMNVWNHQYSHPSQPECQCDEGAEPSTSSQPSTSNGEMEETNGECVLSVDSLASSIEYKSDAPPNNGPLRKALEELITTERDYVMGLRKTMALYHNVEPVRSTLGCTQRLVKNQEKLLIALERCFAPLQKDSEMDQLTEISASVSKVFIDSCGHLKVHAEYAAAFLRLQRAVSASDELKERLKSLNPSGEHSTSYESRMIQPVQRVARYPLLLDAISRCCTTSRETANITEQAASKMRSLLHYVNEMQRIEEHLSPRLKSIRAKHAQFLLSKGLRMEMGEMIMLVKVLWVQTTTEVDCFLFVYSSLVLLLPSTSSPQTESVLLPLDEVSFQEATDSSLLLLHIPLFSSSSTPFVYHINLPSPARKHLIKHIRKARLTLQKGKRPLSGSSKSDGGYASDHSPS
ncbi:tiam-1, partial [Pristionchus pacificus]